MNQIKSLLQKIKTHALTLQLFFVVLAFAVMVLSSYFFVSSIERQSLANNTKAAIAYAQERIETEIRAADINIQGVAQAIRAMIGDEYVKENMENYLNSIHNNIIYREQNHGLNGIYLYLENGDFFQTGVPRYRDGAEAKNSAWYVFASATETKTTVKPDEQSGSQSIIYSRKIGADNGNIAGVVALDIDFNTITRHLANIHLNTSTYAILHTEDAVILTHPNQDLIGAKLNYENSGGIADLIPLLEKEENDALYEYTTLDSSNKLIIVSYLRLGNGWYLGILTPRNIYYQNTQILALFLSALGATMAIALSIILVSITRSRRKADQFTQIIFDGMPLACAVINSERKFLMCNNAAVKLYGAPNHKHYLENFFAYSPDTQPDGKHSITRAHEYMTKAFEEGYVRFEWTHKNYTTWKDIPAEITLIRAQYDGMPALLAYIRDMTEEKEHLKLLREADERAMMMLDSTPLGITMWDKSKNLIDFNYEAARVLGIYDKQEYRERFGETAPEFQPDGVSTAERLEVFINETFEKGASHTTWCHNSITGELIPFEATAVRLKYKDEDVALVFCRDLREINAAMDEAREADERAQILVDTMPLCANFWNKDMHNIDCNYEAVRLFELQSKQDYLDRFMELSPEFQPDGTLSKTLAADYVKRAFKEGYCRFEWMHQKLDGTPIPCEITLIRVKYKGDDVVVGYSRDLREFKEMIKNMHRAELAERGNRAKSKFLAAMSHEIRTPMNVILGVAEMQLQDDTLPAHHREALMQIYNSSDLLLGIINDILDLSKIEADKMEFVPTKYELASLINDTASLNVMRSSKPTEFELHVDENAPACLYGDELRIKQILNNILSNAFKFTDDGLVKLLVNVEEAEADENVTLCLTVHDSGRGMSREELARLFTEYTRFNLENNRTIEGTGLGMNITQRLINMMGGKIAVDSDLGKGTTVSVRLPQKRVGEEKIGKELADNLRKFRGDASKNIKRMPFKRDYMPYGRVLIVDDVESNLYVAKGLLTPYGLAIETSNSGMDALKKIRAGEIYDIIFMDHMMPKMDGIETTKLMRESGYTHPVVALTANAVVGQADLFLKNGFDGFISKPIDVRQLNAVLNKLVRDKQTPEILKNAEEAKEALLSSMPMITSGTVAPELLAVFARDAASALPALEEAAKNIKTMNGDEISKFTICIHGMKSALANIGEIRLSQMAYALEMADMNGNRDKIALQLRNFIKALRGVAAKAEVEGKTRDAAQVDEDPAFLRAQLKVIADACKNYDERTVSTALEKLKEKSWTAETESLLDRIESNLLHSSFDEAAQLAESFIE